MIPIRPRPSRSSLIGRDAWTCAEPAPRELQSCHSARQGPKTRLHSGPPAASAPYRQHKGARGPRSALDSTGSGTLRLESKQTRLSIAGEDPTISIEQGTEQLGAGTGTSTSTSTSMYLHFWRQHLPSPRHRPSRLHHLCPPARLTAATAANSKEARKLENKKIKNIKEESKDGRKEARTQREIIAAGALDFFFYFLPSWPFAFLSCINSFFFSKTSI